VRVVISAKAFVYDRERNEVSDPAILRSLDGLAYEDEVFTDYLGGPPAEDALREALERGGRLRFVYRADRNELWRVTEYRTLRPLSEPELDLLVASTRGQWSDGIGENFTSHSLDRCGYTVDCALRGRRSGERVQPLVEIHPD